MVKGPVLPGAYASCSCVHSECCVPVHSCVTSLYLMLRLQSLITEARLLPSARGNSPVEVVPQHTTVPPLTGPCHI